MMQKKYLTGINKEEVLDSNWGIGLLPASNPVHLPILARDHCPKDPTPFPHLVSSFSVTVVMAQDPLPGRLGLASGLMVGFAIGTGGLGVTLLHIVADAWGVPAALSAMAFMPPLGLLLSLFLPARSG